ncbi:nuclear transport factor 2 family protein [soil metagenome]
MSQENVAIVQGLYAAFGRGDLAAVREKMDSGIEWYEAENFPYDDGNPYFGPDGVYARLTDDWEEFGEEVRSVLDAGEHVVSIGCYTGTYKPTARSVWAQFVHVWTVKDGIVTAFEQYTDTAQFRDVTGPRTTG